MIVITLLFVWESEGVKISSLDQDEYNYRNRVYYFVGVACITIMYAIVMTILGVAGVIIPSKAVRDLLMIFFLMHFLLLFFFFLVNIFRRGLSFLVVVGCSHNECYSRYIRGLGFCKETQFGYLFPQNCCGIISCYTYIV